MSEQDQLQEGSTMKSASPNQPQGLVLSRDAGRALDALVAEKVMGWTALHRRDGGSAEYLGTVPDNSFVGASKAKRIPGKTYCVPEYSTDIAAAWLVVERVQTLHPGWRFDLIGGDVSFGYKRRPGRTDDYVVDKSRRKAFGWRAAFFGHEDPTQDCGQRHADEWAETPALAICRAALVALEAT